MYEDGNIKCADREGVTQVSKEPYTTSNTMPLQFHNLQFIITANFNETPVALDTHRNWLFSLIFVLIILLIQYFCIG